MPSQRKRILVAAGHLPDAEQPDQRLQLVGQRDREADLVARQAITRKAWLVVILDGQRNVFGPSVVQRVVAPHRALQLRELADHAGQQVGLGQQGGLVGLGRQRVAAQLLPDGAGDRAHAPDALALHAELAVVDDLVEPRHTLLEPPLAVLIEEELGVRQARPHHPLVAADHRARVVGGDVADDQELVGEPARRVEQRKVFLVGLHREDEALGRHGEELFLEAAQQHVGPLDQRRHLVEQGRIVDRHQPFACRHRLQLARDLAVARREAGDHPALLQQLLRVVVGVLQHHRLHARLEAVAAGLAAGGQPQRRHRHDLGAVQRHQRVRRAHELHAVPAWQFTAFELVAHEFGNRQPRDRLVQRLLQPLRQGGTGHTTVEKQGLGLAVHAPRQPGHRAGVGAERSQLLEQRRGGLAVGAESDAGRHELLRHRPVGRRRQHRAHVRGQAPRRRVNGHCRMFGGQTLGPQAFAERVRKGFAELLQRLGRQLLDQQFDQQAAGSTHHAAFFSLFSRSSCATHSRGAIGKPRRARLCT